MNIAAIDIGTNTMLTVIGHYSARGGWIILHDIHAIARLGEGVDRTGAISPHALARARVIAGQIRDLCDSTDVHYRRAVATSAIRDASNGTVVCAELSSILNCTIDVISGDEEARLSFMGTVETAELQTVIDIGGGSTEYCTGENYIIQQRKSLQIGAVRLYERYLKSLPPTPESVAEACFEVRQQLQTLPHTQQGVLHNHQLHNHQSHTGTLVGVGGTCTTLAALDLALPEFNAARVHGHILTREAIERWTMYLLSTPLHELKVNPAVHPDRADILPAGAIILHETLKFFNTENCMVSTKGLRYGVLYNSLMQ